MKINVLGLIKKLVILVIFFPVLFGLRSQRVVFAIAPSSLVFDRGLPTANLNLNADSDPSNDANRSNNTIFAGAQDILGDDFTIGTSGEIWIIDKIRVWTDSSKDVSYSDSFTDLKLYGSKVADSLTQLMIGNFTSGNVTDNPNIQISSVKYANGQDFFHRQTGEWTSLYQIDFNNLSWTVDGGVKYQFGIHASGKPVGEDMIWVWNSHISNKDLSGSPQQGADDLVRAWPNPTAPVQLINLQTVGAWNKPADVNIQIWAHKLQKPEKRCRTISNRFFSKEFCITIPKKPEIIRPIRPREVNDEKTTNTEVENNIIIHTESL